MRLRVLLTALAASSSLLLPVAAAPASAAVPRPTVATAEAKAYSLRVHQLVNAERTRRGLRPVAWTHCPDRFSDAWSLRLSQLGRLAHQPMQPILSGCSARRVGENVAFGNVSADAMMRMWMASPGHRANILNPAFTHIGVGATKTSSGRWYGVQVFVRR